MRQTHCFFDRNTIVKFVLALAFAFIASVPRAETDTLLLLHTNDIHDHLRSDYDGSGGLPQVSTYIQQVRSQRPDTITLDAGDVLEKGDMLPYATQGAAVYEAMRLIGYDAGVPGNHDWCFGVKRLSELEAIGGYPMLGIDARDPDGNAFLPASIVLDVDGVKVGVIGSTRGTAQAVAEGFTFLAPERMAEAIAAEAASLEEKTDLLIFLGHRSSKECQVYAAAAPTVDVFVSGHSHEQLDQPIVIAETGALIVQAGSGAEFVGRVELVVDLDANKVVSHKGSLVAMEAAKFKSDPEMQEAIERGEAEFCPMAFRRLTDREKPLGEKSLAKFAAEALLAKSGADVALADPSAFKSSLPAGPIDGNAVHRLYEMGPALNVVMLPINGAALRACLTTVKIKKNKVLLPAGLGERGVEGIDTERVYNVAATSGVAQILKRSQTLGLANAALTPCGFNVVDAIAEHLGKSSN